MVRVGEQAVLGLVHARQLGVLHRDIKPASLPPGSYTLYAQATDSYGVLGDPLAYMFAVQ